MAKKLTDDAKVFDVAKPGKGKIVTTSRPVVAPLVAESITDTANAENKPSESMAPSAARKIIQPITVTDNSSDGSVVKTSTPQTIQTSPDSLTEEMEKAINQTEEDAGVPDANAEPGTKIAIALGPSQPEPTPKPDITPAPKDPEPEPEEELADEDVMSSDSASVDALAKEAEEKTLDKSKQNAEEQLKRDADVQTLIDSKKYVVPISHESVAGKSSKWILFAVLAIVLILAGLYGAIKAELIDYDLPWEQEAKSASVQPVSTVEEDATKDEDKIIEGPLKEKAITDKEIVDPATNGLKLYKDPSGFNFNYPENWKRYEGKDRFGTWIATNDYKEADSGQLSIIASGAISIELKDTFYSDNEETDSKDIQSLEELRDLYKSRSVWDYYDGNSMEIIEISNKKVLRYDSGHTTDGVNHEWLDNGKIVSISYSTKNDESDYGEYKKEASYKDFVKLIESVKF